MKKYEKLKKLDDKVAKWCRRRDRFIKKHKLYGHRKVRY